MRGDRLRAIEFAERGLQVREMIGDVEGMSRSHSNLGATLLNLGRWDDALPHLERSLEFKRRIGDAKNLPAAYTNLGHYYLYKGDTKRARDYLHAARRQAERLRDSNILSYILNALAFADLLDENWNAAAQNLELALNKAKETGALEALLESQWMLAETELQLGDAEGARRIAGEALDGAQTHGLKQAEASALRSLGAVERALGNFPAAESHLHRSLAIFNELQNPFEAARAELEMGQLYCERSMVHEARSHLESSRSIFQRLGANLYAEHAGAALHAIA
jgi:tetratricopeptide (TPR) repeat protein